MASKIIRNLRAVGVSVWWDEDMHSIDWTRELERQINELATMVVLWTPQSVESGNVKDEARLGLESAKLINVLYGLSKPPFPFDRVNGLPLDDWTENEPHHAWSRLVQTIEEKVVEIGGAAKGDFTSVLARQEEARAHKLETLARAQEALEEAQARESETGEAAQAAQTAFARAEEQHMRVLEMRATHLIISAAAQAYEASRAAKEDADRALRAAKAEVKGAQREVALAKAALEGSGPDAAHGRPKAAAAPPVTGKSGETSDAAPAAAQPAKTAPPAAQPTPPKAVSTSAAAKAETRAPEAPARSGPSNLLIGAAAVILAGVAGAGLMLLTRHPKPAANVAPPPASPASVDAKAEAVKIAAPMAGKWAPEGLTCDSAVLVAIKNGDISMTVGGTTSSATIEVSPKAGVIYATGEQGGNYIYKLEKPDALSMTDPNGQAMRMTKCSG